MTTCKKDSLCFLVEAVGLAAHRFFSSFHFSPKPVSLAFSHSVIFPTPPVTKDPSGVGAVSDVPGPALILSLTSAKPFQNVNTSEIRGDL